MIYTLGELQRMAAAQSERDNNFYSLYLFITKLKKYVNEEDVYFTYPKNLFIKGKKYELYAFTEKQIFTVDEKEDKVCIRVISKSEIKELQVAEGNENDDGISLSIIFKDNSQLVLKSTNDTTSYHVDKFKTAIEEIIKHLI
jgi:hypothetical protein